MIYIKALDEKYIVFSILAVEFTLGLLVMLILEKIISNKLIKSGEVIIMPKIIICSWIKSGG